MFKSIYLSLKNLSRFERILWFISAITVTVSFLLPNEKNIVSLIACLIGVTALIFVSKGDVLGQILTVVFSVFYGIISYSFSYYGEMLTYLCMTAPIAVLAIVSWIKNPYSEKEVKVNCLKSKELFLMFLAALAVTFAFYFILKYINTTNLVFSTISVTTSFIASYLTFRRSPLYALGYAANDVILITLWILAAIKNTSYIPMIFCFIAFLANDLYGFFNWSKMRKRQKA